MKKSIVILAGLLTASLVQAQSAGSAPAGTATGVSNGITSGANTGTSTLPNRNLPSNSSTNTSPSGATSMGVNPADSIPGSATKTITQPRAGTAPNMSPSPTPGDSGTIRY